MLNALLRQRLVGQMRRRAVDQTINGLANFNDLTPRIRQMRERLDILKDIPYQNTGLVDHQLDIYRPKKATEPLPVVLYMHGGGFTLCSKESHRTIATIYAAQGYLVCNINYRLAPAHPFPAALEDAAAAYQWVVENVAQYGGDINRLIVAGESAGGNLALGLTVCACYKRPEPWAKKVFNTGVVPIASQVIMGLLQVSDPLRYRRLFGRDVLGQNIMRDIERVYLRAAHTSQRALADPLCIVEQDAPARPLPAMFMAVGTADILTEDTRRLQRALARRDVTPISHYYPREQHAFHALFWRENAKQYWQDCFRFLKTHVPD